jgi:hypothetical protein
MTHPPRRVFILTTLFSFAAAAAAVANPPTHFVVTATSPVYAGAPFTLTVAPYDDQGNLGRVTDILHFTSSDPEAALPADTNDVQCDCWPPYSFRGVVLAAPGTRTITVTYLSNSSVSGIVSIDVLPSSPEGPVTRFQFTAPGGIPIGTPFSATVTAYNAQGIVVSGYSGTVHFTSTNPATDLPADYTFTASDAGSHTFTMSFQDGQLYTMQYLTVSDGTVSATVPVDLTTGPAVRILVSAPASVYAGAPFSFTVSPLDSRDNIVGWGDWFRLSSSDPTATIPSDHQFGDHGPPYPFTGIVLSTVGAQTITVALYDHPEVTGTATIDVLPSSPEGPVTRFLFDAPGSVTVGTPFSATVTAYNAQGVVVSGYTGTVHFTSTDPQGAVPGDYTFQAGDAGRHTFSNEFGFGTGRPGDHWTLTVSDGAVTQSIDVTIGAGPTTHFQVDAPGSVVSGAVFTVVVTPLDDRGNLAAYRSVMHFSSSDPAATLPADFNTNRDVWPPYHVPNFILSTTGPQSITVSDVTNPLIRGSALLRVTPSTSSGPVARLRLEAPASVVAGTPFSIRLTALDANGTVASRYTGTVLLVSSDSLALLPASYAFTPGDSGSRELTGIVMRTPGPHQTVTATDSFSAGIAGTATVAVSPPPPVIPVQPPGTAPIEGRR